MLTLSNGDGVSEIPIQMVVEHMLADLGYEIEPLTLDRAVAGFDGKGNKIEPEVPGTKIGNVETQVGECNASDLCSCGCSRGRHIQSGAYSNEGPCLHEFGENVPGPSFGTGRVNFSGAA